MTVAFVDGLKQRLAARLHKGAFLRHVGVLAGGTAIGQATSVLVAPILTRLYTPADLGLLGVFSAFVLTLGGVAAARYDVAVVAADDEDDAAALTCAAVLAAIPLTAVICGLAWLLIRQKWMGFGSMPMHILPFVAVAVFVTAVFAAFRYWFIRAQIFGTVSKVSVYQGVMRSIVQVALGIVHAGWMGLIAGDVAGRMAGIGRMSHLAWRSLKERTRSFAIRPIVRVMVRYREFPKINMPSTLIDTVALNLTIPLIAQVFGAAPAGQFTLVQRLLTLPLGIISMSVADAFHGRAAAYVRDEPHQLRRFYLRTARGLFLSGLVPVVLLIVFAPMTVAFIFGSKWEVAGVLVALMAPAALAQVTVSPLTRVILVTRRGMRAKLVLDLINMVMVIGTIVGAGRAGLGLNAAVGLYSAALTFLYLLYFVIMLKLVEYDDMTLGDPV